MTDKQMANGDDWQTRLSDEGRWQQLRGRLRQMWGALTDDDLENARGSRDKLIGKIKEKTGETAEEIERKLASIPS
ncbi:MAG TPA: CsbD family protein [Acidimicrobiia bacterium]|jgi:uncharacterized protein YjbJ (UPF0337 family)